MKIFLVAIIVIVVLVVNGPTYKVAQIYGLGPGEDPKFIEVGDSVPVPIRMDEYSGCTVRVQRYYPNEFFAFTCDSGYRWEQVVRRCNRLFGVLLRQRYGAGVTEKFAPARDMPWWKLIEDLAC